MYSKVVATTRPVPKYINDFISAQRNGHGTYLIDSGSDMECLR